MSGIPSVGLAPRVKTGGGKVFFLPGRRPVLVNVVQTPEMMVILERVKFKLSADNVSRGIYTDILEELSGHQLLKGAISLHQVRKPFPAFDIFEISMMKDGKFDPYLQVALSSCQPTTPIGAV